MAKKVTKRKMPPRRPPKLLRTDELCKDLARIAAFNLNDWPKAQMKVYEAIKRLQQLDAAAVEAGLLPS